VRVSVTNALGILGCIVAAGIGWGRLETRQTELVEWQKSANVERREILDKLADIQDRLVRIEGRRGGGAR